MSEKILVIRMLELGDVVAVGLPVIRMVKQRMPDAEVHVLTYGEGIALLKAAEPSTTVFGLETGQWPEQMLPAMEVFLGLAEQIVGQSFTQIINLDVSFMPCFLARFLADAGEPVVGNRIGCSVGELIDGFQQQSLSPDYVVNTQQYLASSWLSMSQWQSRWWESDNAPSGGYPEFYLRRCCGYSDIDLDMSITVKDSVPSASQPIVAIAQATSDPTYTRYCEQLMTLLEAKGIATWQMDCVNDVSGQLAQLASSQLLVSYPGTAIWLAKAVNTQTLMISGQTDPRIVMPDFATDPGPELMPVEELANDIVELLSEAAND